LLVAAYNAAHLFVMPSLQEAFGLTALEAMACGTPTVGFAAGGILDIVDSGVTGLLVPVGDSQALAHGIGELLENQEQRASFAAGCRRSAVQNFGLRTQARRYAEVYERLIKDGEIS
jgi:glycosyltransferase involved in cell wall biosynthesis